MSQQPLPVSDAFHALREHVASYAERQSLPHTEITAIREVHIVIREIEQCQAEGHPPFHHDIPWRIAYLLLCVCQVERINPDNGYIRDHAARYLEDMGVPLSCALELAQTRLQALCAGEPDIEHIDTAILVPIMRQALLKK